MTSESGALDRRRALGLLLGGGVLLGACASSSGSRAGGSSTTSSTSRATSSTTTATETAAEDCPTEIPEETNGPFPADGTNGPDVLDQDGVVRRDIRSSFGDATGTAEGVPLALDLRVVDLDGCTPLAGAAVYVWHCDRAGRYSIYSPGATDANYLRGVQVTGADGTAGFTTIFPGCYPGRWPHVHFEVYPDLATAKAGGGHVTSQLAFPQATCEAVYEATGYDASVGNLAALSLDADQVFSDGYANQVAVITGGGSAGYRATLPVGVRNL